MDRRRARHHRAQPRGAAPDLATELGLESVVFKRDVRNRKERGLTESLDVGYGMAPRGLALLDGPELDGLVSPAN